MKTAVIMPTINVPHVLKLYEQQASFAPTSSVWFFVVVDDKTPQSALDLCDSIRNCRILDDGDSAGYQSAQYFTGIQRRNLALLEALKWGADVIISIDDDNFSMGPDYFYQFGVEASDLGAYKHQHLFSGLRAKGSGTSPDAANWFDPGSLLEPITTHRGFPHNAQIADNQGFEPVVNARIGVHAGLVLGDPDIGAVDRIVDRSHSYGVSEIGRAGIVVNPATTWTVFNSQNTAFVRELAPAMMMWPDVGRYDDIFASLLCQRIMEKHGYHVRFGPPFVWQQRKNTNLLRDLKGEIYGMEHVEDLATFLNAFPLVSDSKTVVEHTASIFNALLNTEWPSIVGEAGLAWCEDVKTVL